jgi:Zn-dependent protease
MSGDPTEGLGPYPQPAVPDFPEPESKPFHQAPRPPRRRGVFGGLAAALAAIIAYGKYLIVLPKFGFLLTTSLSMLVSFGLYAVFFQAPGVAAGLIVMIFIHEMGHVLEIRRQGMKASAPVFIPFIGAAIFQRQHATDALHQAEIGIAGPIAGTVGATAAFVLFSATHQPFLLFWAYLGFFINLVNLIPLGMLDGGWVLAVASKWFQVLGVALLALATVVLELSPLFLVVALISIPAVIDRFRYDRMPYYQSVPVPARWAMGAAWLMMVGYLGFATFSANQLLAQVVSAR